MRFALEPLPLRPLRALCTLLTLTVVICTPCSTRAEDGYSLWLRNRELAPAAQSAWRSRIEAVVAGGLHSAQGETAVQELRAGLSALLAEPMTVEGAVTAGRLIVGTPESLDFVRGLELPLAALGEEGFVIRTVPVGQGRAVVLAANREVGLLYGAFALLRAIQGGAAPEDIDLMDAPRVRLRLLDHWDNLDRSVERGYAGQSIWDWWRLPDLIDPRYRDYARANASIGINGAVLNNVNARAEILSSEFIAKVAAIATALRPYGVRVYLSVRFSSPIELGGLKTSDPLDPAVGRWWRDTADAIYAQIPDFGGFLVKANSEEQPGPQDYGRSHADGANMLAEALAPHGGVVMWRAFVYSPHDPDDRVKQAYSEFRPLDGAFRDNVLLQVKNGPLDFQPREPFHPLLGAMPRTPLMLEFQITQEYLGFATHLVYLGTLYAETLAADTARAGPGSTVARVVDGSLHGHRLSGMAGVANIGSDRDWSGSSFAQANWYAFGRLAWNPGLSARAIAEEWLRATFSTDPAFLTEAADLMLRSREAAVDYMTPLGLTHLMGTGDHYGPAPWVDDLARPEWNPFYYHRADRQGIGFDRTVSGSNAVAQYAPPVAQHFARRAGVPEELLLWFHRVPWDYRMRSGQTLWATLVERYDRGVSEVDAMRASWDRLAPYVDAERHRKTSELLTIQAREARWWRDACIAYFQARSGLALPAGVRPPARTLEHYQGLAVPYAPGNWITNKK